MSMEREKLYLLALLEGVPDPFIQKTFNRISTNQTSALLKLANNYASAGVGEDAKMEFVSSPFEGLKKANPTDKDYRFPIQEWSLSRSFFPQKNDTAKDFSSIDELWKKFSAAFEQAAYEDYRRQAEFTLSLLHKYAVTIPSPRGLHSEISWYDYAKIKAGLAVCVYDYLDHAGRLADLFIQDDEVPLLLIRADVSGIQNFIGNIASKNASKNLKGRSFYVQLLSESVLRYTLKAFQLFKGNIMYAAGGNFFVIAPNTPSVVERFAELEREITKKIFKEHGTGLSVVLGKEEVSQSEILRGAIDEAINRLFEREINKKKKQKFASLLESEYAYFFEPSEVGGKESTDAITGEEIDRQRETNLYVLEEDKAMPKLMKKGESAEGKEVLAETTAKQIFLGQALRDMQTLIFSDAEPQMTSEKVRKKVVEPCHLATWIFPAERRSDNPFPLETSEVLAVNGFEPSTEKADGFVLYGGNQVPWEEEENRPKYFHEISGDGDFKRLAVLRMDIDNLGSIFKHYIPYPDYQSEENKGSKRPHLSFSWYAALSRHLDWFFKGYLNTLWEEKEGYKENTQIIYSGGDDLFVIGRWNIIVSLAEEIKEEFLKFTCYSGLSISGGISIVTHKFPIMKAGEFAGEAEHEAKAHQLKRPESGELIFQKNSLSFLGLPLHWDSEFVLVKKLKDDLLRHLAPSGDDTGLRGIPRSLLGKIRTHYYMMKGYEQLVLRGERANPRWIWVATYDFSRFIRRLMQKQIKFIEELRGKIQESGKEVFKNFQDLPEDAKRQIDFLDKIKIAVFSNRYKDENGQELMCESSYHFLELLYLAARWAELTLRSETSSN